MSQRLSEQHTLQKNSVDPPSKPYLAVDANHRHLFPITFLQGGIRVHVNVLDLKQILLPCFLQLFKRHLTKVAVAAAVNNYAHSPASPGDLAE